MYRTRTPQSRLLVAGILVLLVVFGPGYDPRVGAATANSVGVALPSDAAPPSKQVLTLIGREGTYLDWSKTVQKGQWMPGLMSDPLVMQDYNSDIKPLSAARWAVSSDGRTWTFTLRPGLRWSDGTPLTAADFVYTIRRMANPETGFDVAWYFSALKNFKEANEGKAPLDSIGAVAVNPTTLALTTTEPTPYLLMLLSDLYVVPAHVVGNSGGASIALRLAAKRPELFRSLVVHEPPLLDLLKGRAEFQPMLDGFNERIGAVIALLDMGDNAAAAERFVNTVAFGPGAWVNLPRPIRDTFIRNAPTFRDETRDPEGLTIEFDSLRRFDRPVLLSIGTQSPPFFKPIVQTVAAALSTSRHYTFDGAGHVPHISHPELYVETVRDFCQNAGRLHAQQPGINQPRRAH